MSTTRVLLIEDDPLISASLRICLELQGYVVTLCETAGAALQQEPTQFDLVLLDVNLPDQDGYTVCRAIRQRDNQIPILMLTANIAEDSAVRGIDAGADDYIRKPFGVQELVARMRRALERHQKTRMRYGTLCVDPDQHFIWSGSVKLDLGKREFAILAALVARAGNVVTRQEILDNVDQDIDVYDRTIDSHLSHLRKKLKNAGATEIIVPVYGVGYRLELP